MTKILLPVEDKTFAEAQVDFLSKHELPADTHVLILSVIVPLAAPDYGFAVPHAYLEAIAREDEKACKQLLSEVENRLREKFPNASIETRIETGRPAAEIVRIAKEENCDWIVLGSHGRSGLDRFFLGSVSLSVVSHAHCSVSIVRVPQADKSKQDKGKEVASTAKA